LAVCQPCIAALAAVSLMEQNAEDVVPRTLTLIAGPVNSRMSPTAVNRFATDHDMSFFEDRLIRKVPVGYAGTGRKVLPGFMQLTGFVMMNRDKHRQAYVDYFRAVADGDAEEVTKHEEFYDDYNAVLDMPAEYFLETIEKVFLEAQLADGTLELCGQKINPAAMKRTALLTVEGDRDDVTGSGQTHISHLLCSSIPKGKRGKLNVEGVGHYGAFSGSRFKTHAVPVISRFIRKHA
jgi:poly(3-hydroxybutyrate) depolymerase